MVVEIKEITPDKLNMLLAQIGRPHKKTLAAHFGKLKRGLDGLEYQKTVRNEWD